jgi:hypothetical protein
MCVTEIWRCELAQYIVELKIMWTLWWNFRSHVLTGWITVSDFQLVSINVSSKLIYIRYDVKCEGSSTFLLITSDFLSKHWLCWLFSSKLQNHGWFLWGCVFGCCPLCVVDWLSTPNIIASVRHAWLHEFAVRAMREKKMQVLIVATVVSRNANEVMVAPMVGCGGVCVWRESGVRRSVWCFCV